MRDRFFMDYTKFYGTGLQENDKPRTTYFSNGQLFTFQQHIQSLMCSVRQNSIQQQQYIYMV